LQAVRPLNLGETLDASIKIVAARWRTLAIVMLVIALPIQLLTVIITSATTDVYKVGSNSWTGGTGSGTTYGDEDAYAAGQVAIIALQILGYLLGTVACYRAIADQYLGRPTGARDTLRFAGSRLGATLWLTIIFGVGLFFAFIALIIPGIWLTVAWAVAYPVMLVEGLGGAKALGRSFKLVEKFWWATAGRLIVAYILTSLFAVVASFVFLIPAELLVDDTSVGAQILEAAANLVTSLLTTPFIAAVVTLTYFDLRVRKEGFDLALLAERMGGAPATDAPSTFGAPTQGRDAFGNPVAPAPPSPPPASPPPPPGGFPPVAPPASGWAPPVAPEPQRPPSQDE
jgi:hypothetical protein